MPSRKTPAEWVADLFSELRAKGEDMESLKRPGTRLLVILTDHCGLTVQEDDELVGISGQLDRKKRLIRLAPDEMASRRNFTLAHELGHYLMHREPVSCRYERTDAVGEKEIEADDFAGRFLIPRDALIELYYSEELQLLPHIKRARAVADHFLVGLRVAEIEIQKHHRG